MSNAPKCQKVATDHTLGKRVLYKLVLAICKLDRVKTDQAYIEQHLLLMLGVCNISIC